MLALAVEVAEEVRVVVRSDDAGRLRAALRALRQGWSASSLHGASHEVDRERDEDHDEQESEHPSRVERPW